MAWLILARLVFFVGVTYAAAVLQPFGALGAPANAAFGGILALAAIALEWRMHDVSVPHLLGALIGAALGLLFADLVSAALMATGDPRWTFFRRVVLLVFPYIGLVIGARRGETGAERAADGDVTLPLAPKSGRFTLKTKSGRSILASPAKSAEFALGVVVL